MDRTTPRQAAGTVISVHQTSQGIVRYRRWPGSITVEILDKPTTILAVVRGTDSVNRSAR